MFDKCINCARMGESCVPNLMLLPFAELMQWCAKRQKHLGWTNLVLSEHRKVPIGTINRIKAGDYEDCRYSTIKHILIALIGGTTDEFSCTEMVERELAQKEQLQKQADDIAAVREENARLTETLRVLDDKHRCDIRAVQAEYQKQIDFLLDEVKAWRKAHTGI